MSALLCVLLPAAMWWAIPGPAWSSGGETSAQNPQRRIRAFKIERPLPLDGDLGKWRGIGIDFCVNGKDPATGEYDYFDWCGLKVFHDPSGYGELLLAGTRVRQ